mmetsp:Transcript_13733/g.18895  ORF Transcript_13733/g.18895 Transcript_13733/m.18895 type:complete len:339 (-) Transcript_13733:128-1144(-)
MGGCFQTYNPGGNVSPVAEANVHNDPEAADLVFSARWKKRLRIVPMDVTEKTRLSYSFIEQFGKLSNKAGPFVHKIVQFYYKRYEFCEKEGRKKSEEFSEKRESERDKIRYDGPDTEQKETTIPVHDSSAMMGYFHPKVYTWRSLMVRVECKGQWTRGMCVGWGPEREEKGEREERGEKGEEGEEGGERKGAYYPKEKIELVEFAGFGAKQVRLRSPGGGLDLHIDRSSAYLTVLYYLNECEGGEIVLYMLPKDKRGAEYEHIVQEEKVFYSVPSPKEQNEGRKEGAGKEEVKLVPVVVKPKANRLVIFLSRCVPHEVLHIDSPRLAFQVWYSARPKS